MKTMLPVVTPGGVRPSAVAAAWIAVRRGFIAAPFAPADVAATEDGRTPQTTVSTTAARRLAVVALYAAAMAWVESAVVYYLRTMIDRIEPHQPNPLPIIGDLGSVELAREAATMIMLLTVGMLAGRTWRSRLGYSAIAFGVWDIFYYVFLKLMCGWPHSLFDWDILFLLPLPWWGPVLAPVSIAVLMILWGAVATRFDGTIAGASSWRSWGLNYVGVILALYVFMADSIKVAGQGVDVLRSVLPEHFNWPWFTVAILLMSAPIASAVWRIPKHVGDDIRKLSRANE